MSHLWILLAALFAVGECRRAYSEGEEEVITNCVNKDVDAYLDKVIEKAREELPDPMRLPPKSTVVELSDGVLWGLSELVRVGPAKVTCEGETITIEAKISTDELKGRYTWKKERKNKSDREGYVVIICDDFEADATVVIEKKDSEVHPRLEKFVIKRFKDVRVEMTGLSYLTWALGEITTLMSGIFQRAIASTVQDPIKEALERQMREISIHA